MSIAEKHPYFDLWLHTDGSLAQAIGRQIRSRVTIHEWPLSAVQKIICDDGSKLIYKSQSRATVEPEFYGAARSRVLPAYQTIGEINGCHAMVFEYIEGTCVSELSLDASQILALGQRVQREIDLIDGTLPAYTDIGSSEKWLASAEETIQTLFDLTDHGIFTALQPKMISELRDWASHPKLLELLEATSTFTHGDLNGGNILLAGGVIRLIDWQRPRIAPAALDTVALLESKGIDAYGYMDREAVQLYHFLKAGWFVECQTVHFPDGPGYEQQILEALNFLC